MQTFLPYPSFIETARCLDNKRLGKQRVECIQIIKALSDPTYGWQSHPAVKMWRGYERALIQYGTIICNEWIDRGFNDTCREKLAAMFKNFDPSTHVPPFWWCSNALHSSHRSNLLRKDQVYYSKFNWTEPSNLPYVWPV